MRTHLLIDADTLVYRAGLRAEQPIQWDEDIWTLHAHASDGIQELNRIVTKLQEELGAELVTMALSDYDAPNWRNGVLPSYKEARGDARRPILWKALRDYIHSEDGIAWRTYQRPGLEGDDVLGILMTGQKPKTGRWRRVCVSIDKDLKTIPGIHLNYDRAFESDRPFEELLFEVTKAEADRFHLIQAVAGDLVDGYYGCPGIGMVRAERFLEAGRVLEPVEHTYTRGARKGDTELRWEVGEEGTPWEVVVSIYRSKGLTEEDALAQARVARILRASDYNFKTKEVVLWTPPHPS